jgi:hypothetical protein
MEKIQMSAKQFALLVVVCFSILGGEIFMGSAAWSEVGRVNWVGPTQTFNPQSMNQYFVANYSVVTPVHGTFNFTGYFVLHSDIPSIGAFVRVTQDHDGAIHW